MLVPDTPLLGFRALQTLTDLRAAAERQPIVGISRLVEEMTGKAPRSGDTGLSRVLLEQGGRLDGAEDRIILDALMLAASQPERDPEAFVCATAILLADRIQRGLGTDRLGSYWETFRPVYFGLAAPDRAAIVQGFLTGACLGCVDLPDPAPSMAHLTETSGNLQQELLMLARRDAGALSAAVFEQLDNVSGALARQHLQALLAGLIREPLTGDSMLFSPLLSMASQPRHPAYVAATALLLAEAVRTRDGEGWFGVTLWPDIARSWSSLGPEVGRTLTAGLRHLYEADPQWAPATDIGASPDMISDMRLLPVADTFTAPPHPSTRVG